MKPGPKIIIACAGTVLLMIHFTLVLVYAQPFSPAENKVTYMAQTYVYPYFHQGWNLFAPVPDSNYKLFAEYENNGLQRVDLFNELLIGHQGNRLAGYGPLLVAFSNSIHYFEKNTLLREKLNGPVCNDLYFTIIEQEANNYLLHRKKIKVRKVRLMLVIENVQSKAQRIYFNQ